MPRADMIFETWFQTTRPVSTEAGLGARSHGPGAHVLSVTCTSLPLAPSAVPGTQWMASKYLPNQCDQSGVIIKGQAGCPRGNC